jgi:hypothetical protein
MSKIGAKCVGLAQEIMQHIMPTINSIKEKREGVRRTCYFKCNGKLKKQYEDMSLAEAFDIPNEIRLTVGLQGERKVKITINIFTDMYLYDLETVEEFNNLVFDKLEDYILTNLTCDVFTQYISDIIGENIFSAIND